MTKQTLNESIHEAKRFLKLAKALRDKPDTVFIWGNKETGSVRRASMDLTRKLAELRQGK